MSLFYRLTQVVKTVFPRGSFGWRVLRTPLAVYFWARSRWRQYTKSSIFSDDFEMVSCSLEPYRTLQLVLHLYRPASVLVVNPSTSCSTAGSIVGALRAAHWLSARPATRSAFAGATSTTLSTSAAGTISSGLMKWLSTSTRTTSIT